MTERDDRSNNHPIAGAMMLISWLTAISAQFARRLSRLSRRGARTLAASSVIALHVLFAFVLITAIGSLPAKGPEVSLVLTGGQPGEITSAPKPLDMVAPDVNDIAPPAVDIETPTAIADPARVPPGSPNVTRPAMALAEAHSFPSLPAGYAAAQSKAVVRLVITIARDGAITGAAIAKSCGSDALDRLALEWVKAHWRYQPALENGEAITVTTTAIVAFTRAV